MNADKYIANSYLCLGYVSSDWRVYKNKKLQDLIVQFACDRLQAKKESFHWIKKWEHLHLLVDMSQLSKEVLNEDTLDFTLDYMNGIMDAVGCM